MHFRSALRRRAVPAAFLSAAAVGGAWAQGQVVLDGSLGASGPLSGPNFQITPNLGTRAGANLFHSFSSFNLTSGQTATFSGPADVANVLARVTGGAASNIDGTLRSTIPGANLYLVNPAGVVFGPSAKLDVSGSFVVTTADVVKLAGGGRFNAKLDPADADLLTSAAPQAFGFLSPSPAGVTTTAARFVGAKGKNVSIVSGDIRVQAGLFSAVNGRLNAVAVASPGEVAFDPASPDPAAAVTLGDFDALGDVTVEAPVAPATVTALSADAVSDEDLNSTGEDGPPNSLVLRAANLTARGNVGITTAGETSGATVDVVLTGDLTVDGGLLVAFNSGVGGGGALRVAARRVDLVGGAAGAAGNFAGVFGLAGPAATGAAAPVTLAADELHVTGGAGIASVTLGAANASPVAVAVAGLADLGDDPLAGFTGVYSQVFGTVATGNAAAVTLSAGELRIRNGAGVFSNSSALADAGDVSVVAGSALIDGQGSATLTGIRSEATGVLGNGGDVSVDVRDTLTLTGGGRIRVQNATEGASAAGAAHTAGGVTVAAGAMVLDGAGAAAGTATGVQAVVALAAPRDVAIVAGELTIRNGADVSSLTAGSAAGAGIGVNVARSLLVEGGNARIRAVTAGEGTGGAVTVRAGQITVAGSGEIGTAARAPGTGPAGPLALTVVDGGTLTIDGAGALPTLTSVGSNTSGVGPTAAGGATTVDAGVVRVVAGGQLIASTTGAGPAGDVRVRATRVEIDGAGAELTRIASNTLGDASGVGGNIVIDADEVVARRGAVIDASTGSTAAGGNVTVNARTVLLDRGGDDVPSTGLSSQSLGEAAGPAGVLTVNATESVVLRGGASIAANTSGGGRGGDIRVDAPLVDLDGLGSKRITSIAAEATNITGAPFPGAPPTRVRGGDSGSVEVVADVVRLAGGSQIAASTLAEGQAGRVRVVARQKLTIDGTVGEFSTSISSDASNFGLGGATGDGVTFPPIPGAGPGGNGGPVEVAAGEVEVVGGGEIAAGTAGDGQGGSVTVSARQLTFRTKGKIDASTTGTGNGGSVTVNVEGTTLLEGTGPDDRTGILAQSIRNDLAGRNGDSGSVTVNTGELIVRNGAVVSSATFTEGNGGSLRVAARRVEIDGAGLPEQFTGLVTQTENAGNSGSATVDVAEDLVLLRGGRISAATFGPDGATDFSFPSGQGGSVEIDAGRILVDSTGGTAFTGVRSLSDAFSTGTAGNIEVAARGRFELRGKDAQLSAVTTGPASGGIVTVGAAGLHLTDGASIRSSCTGTGNAGGILVTAAGSVRLSRGAFVATEAELANAGTIKVTAGRSIDLTDGRPGVPAPARAVNEPGLDNTRITAEALRGGQGNITLEAPDRVYLSNSVITAESLDASGARIDIDPVSVVLDNSVINGRAAGADVPVTIVARQFVQSVDSQILSDVASVPVEVDIAGSLTRLPAGLADAGARLAEQCGLRVAANASSFVTTGRGGVPASPDGWSPSHRLAGEGR